MSQLDTEYFSATMREEIRPAIASWARDAAAYRQGMGPWAELDVVYGTGERQRLDIFKPAFQTTCGPVAMFIHGGYWQTLDRSFFSHMARGANAHGLTVVVPGYTLCPQTTLSRIIDEVRAAVAFVVKRFDRPVTVCGHSAGGHLAACMFATDWSTFDRSLRSEVVAAGLPISGLFELEPLVSTSLNHKLRLDKDEARRLSPLFWQAPAGKSITAYVGGNESSEFLRQTRALVLHWKNMGADVTGVEVPGTSHFDIIAPLADPNSTMTHDLVILAKKG